MNILFFDESISGHHLEFISHLAGYKHFPSHCTVYFMVPTKAAELIKSYEIKNVKTIPYDKKISSYTETGEILLDICKKNQVGKLFFLNIDPYQFVIGGSKFRSSKIQISGIYFHPYHRIESDSVKNGLKKIRKRFQIKWMLRNKNISKVYILDDQLDGIILDQKLQYLPDPIVFPASKQSIWNDEGTVKILAFGSIIKRKSLEVLIKAVSKLDSTNYLLHIVGKGEDLYVSSLNRLINEKQSKSRIEIENRFVSDLEKDELFRSADIISMVYKNFYGSSGALGHAAAYGKRVIVSDKGLIKYLTDRFNLGIAVDGSEKSIFGAINTLVSCNQNEAKYNAYLENKTPDEFARRIFEDLNNFVDN